MALRKEVYKLPNSNLKVIKIRTKNILRKSANMICYDDRSINALFNFSVF